MSEADYEIRVRGELSAELQAAFEEFDVSVEPAETVLHGAVLDQAALHGLLRRIEGFGLELVEVRKLAGRSSAGRPTRQSSS